MISYILPRPGRGSEGGHYSFQDFLCSFPHATALIPNSDALSGDFFFSWESDVMKTKTVNARRD